MKYKTKVVMTGCVGMAVSVLAADLQSVGAAASYGAVPSRENAQTV